MYQQVESVKITVFTPAYNRGYIIENLYRSLQRQTYRNFEWIVVDDGSTDNTEQKFTEILSEENDFSIRYIKTQNGGKHRAINQGVENAKGLLFYIVDSDDYLTDDALESINRIENSISEDMKSEFAGVCGLKGYSKSEPIGKTFDGVIIDATTLQRDILGITGDKAEAFYTEVLQQYPFPEFEGENFVTECVVWDKIAKDGFKLRFYNEIIMICNYLPDGLTAQGENLFLKNPRGYALYLYQSRIYGKISGLEMWGEYAAFVEKMKEKVSFLEISKMLHINPVILWLRLLGMKIFYTLYD